MLISPIYIVHDMPLMRGLRKAHLYGSVLSHKLQLTMKPCAPHGRTTLA